MASDYTFQRERVLRCLISFVAIALQGCASSSELAPPSGMRRVFLSSEGATGGTYQSEMLYGGTPTDRFDTRQERAYLYMVFSDGRPHTYQFTVKSVDGGFVKHRSQRVELTGTPKDVTWRGYSHWFGIMGSLSPGDYVLELTIDDRAAGVYPFTVHP
jgi:hypothetical protein